MSVWKFGMWTAFCVLALFVALITFTDAKEYNVSPAKFVLAGDSMVFVDAETATFSGVSEKYYVIRCPGFQAIEPVEEEPPLGWQHKKYFTFHPSPLPTKLWCTVEAGDSIYSSVITQQKGARVITDRQDESKWNYIILMVILALAVWAMGVLLLFQPPKSATRRPVKVIFRN